MLGASALTGISACQANRSFRQLQQQLHYVVDDLGILHAPEFRCRIVAHSGQALSNGFVWPGAPDGGGVINRGREGWIYVCNSELGHGKGGAAALVFDAQGSLQDAYSILSGTSENCSGSVTPWNTWLSCEEHKQGVVWECDPVTRKPAMPLTRLGVFTHEAAAFDEENKIIYLTEDVPDGALYRYVPASVAADGRYDLQQGVLQGCVWDSESKRVTWMAIEDPEAQKTATRYQAELTRFGGGEGVCYRNGMIYFNTKHDDRIWQYDTRQQVLHVYYQADDKSSLHYADAMTSSPDSSLWAGEDGDDMQVVALTQSGRQKVLLQVSGQDHSEITGLAFTADYRRLYFSSQRGPSSRLNSSKYGITYEMEGDFLNWLSQS